MPGYVLCPYCGATVQPLQAPGGGPLCPLCRNQGRAAAFPRVSPAPPPPQAAAPKPMAPGATGALVCGILALLVPVLGIVLGIIAAVLGSKARKAIRAEPGRFAGDGLALTGIILGYVGVGVQLVTVVLAGVVFVLVSHLADDEPAAEFTSDPTGLGGSITVASVHDEGLRWSDLVVATDADCSVPTGLVEVGDQVLCRSDGHVSIARGGETLFDGDL